MKEDILHYVWQFKLTSNTFDLETTDGQPIEIVSTGLHNHDAGPDFLNARIKIGDTLWAGAVEMHLASSDWYKHNHHTNKAYNNVILQVVEKHDRNVERSNGEIIPTLVLEIPDAIRLKYDDLAKSDTDLRCKPWLPNINHHLIKLWLQQLVVKRLEIKAAAIEAIWEQNNRDWEETLYHLLCRAFGFKTNSEPFERLARALPYQLIGKHKDNLTHIEALLFGQAGFLESEVTDAYQLELKNHYQFFRRKFTLQPIEMHNWKFLRLRPNGFPTLRIAQLAMVIWKSQRLIHCTDQIYLPVQNYQLFRFGASEYWHTHFKFGNQSKKMNPVMGTDAIESILINAILPFLFVYGKHTGKEELADKAIDTLEKISAEDNRITRLYVAAGIKPDTASESQAILHLNQFYCTQDGCLKCPIGHQIINIPTI